MSLLNYTKFVESLNEGYGYQLMSDTEISKMPDINILYQFIMKYIQEKGLNIQQPITISNKGDVKIIRSLQTRDFEMKIKNEFNFTFSEKENPKKINIGKGFNVSFGNGTRVAGGTPKGPQFEDHFVSDLISWIELGYEAYKNMYNPGIIKEFIEKTNFSNVKNIATDAVQKVGGQNTKRPLSFNGSQPYIGSLNFEQIGKTLSDVTINTQPPYYISCKTTSTVTFFNSGIQKLLPAAAIDKGNYTETALAFFNMLGIEPEKFTKTFRIRKKENTIINELEELEDQVREKLGIDSADPIYKDSEIRKKWIDEIKKGIEEIGIAEIKAKWKKIFNGLREDGYTILRIFLGLALKVDPQMVSQFELEIKRSSSGDVPAFKDFLNVNLIESEKKFAEIIEVNVDNKILSNFIKSGIGMNYWLVHKGYKGNEDSVKYVDASFLEEASLIEGPVTIYYGGTSGDAVRVDIKFTTKLFNFKINIRDKQGVIGYPTHVMMDYTYR